jgi:hypothetical protein
MADSVKSIGSGKDYSTVNSWYVNWLNTASSFAGGVDNEVGQVYGGVVETSATNFNTGKTSSGHAIILESAAAERHAGKWDTAKAYTDVNHTTVTSYLFQGTDAYVTIRDHQIRQANGNNNSYHAFDMTNANNVMARCILNGSGSVRRALGISGKVYRCIAFDYTVYGFDIDTATGTVIHCVAINCGTGIDCNDVACTVKQCYVGANATAGFEAAGSVVSSKNISSDATSPDGASYQGKNAYTDYFVDYNNDDFHLKATDTVLKDAGDDLGSPYDVDIDGESVTGTWDIGADEYIVSGETLYFTSDITVNTTSAAGQLYLSSNTRFKIQIGGNVSAS